MKNNALYFPYINVPATSFLIETLIYWDKLSSIVPYEFTVDSSKLDTRMRELTSAELINQIQPREYFSELVDFEENFLYIAKIWKSQNTSTTFKSTKIHVEKLGSLDRKLIELDLAKSHDYPWIIMPEPLANIFMTYLATKLGEISEINAIPVTDLSKERTSTEYNTISTIRDDILKEILPIPHGKISIDSILKYKNDYGHLTNNFRERIEEECINIISADLEKREDKMAFVQKRLQSEICEIEETMNSSWKDISRQSILPLMGLTITNVSTDFNSNPGLMIGAGMLTIPAILEGITTYKKSKQIIEKPLAYATITKQHLYSEFKYK